ncbi:hypothetical protein [Williamsia sp.]|uniref:hypothetical protein n=1 Tax=Williamsia sp. TaxID=1872085 RepID=UPI002F94BB92
MHEGPSGNPNNVLASRNILRGIRLELPSGLAVAKKLGVSPIAVDNKVEPESLWYYILKEAEIGGGEHLGAVGSIIVASVFAGLLEGDPHSWINVDPLWSPDTDALLMPGQDNIDTPGSWELASIVRISGVPVEAGGDFS